jgi:cytochrome c oxidase subunit 2
MKKLSLMTALLTGLFSVPAWAQDNLRIDGLDVIGVPEDRKMGFQPAATELARDIHALDYLILVIITIITLFVTGLMIWVIVRYNRRRNAEPASFTHHTPVEIAWTIIPILILVGIGAFSLPVLFRQQEIPPADVTIKVTGYQWYWSYEYVDEGFGFDSYMIGSSSSLDVGARPEDANVTPLVLDDHMIAKLEDAGYSRNEWLLATDTAVVVPVGKTVVMQVTASDVIHSWTVPAFGVKQDGVPGRLAELWFAAEKEGVYFGQCSELCGQAHAYMPITVKVVSEEVYAQWLASARDEYAALSGAIQVASN